MRASRTRSILSMKLLQWTRVWNPRILLPRSPSRISWRQGQIPKLSAFGQGMCQKVMIVGRQFVPDQFGSGRNVILYWTTDCRWWLPGDGLGESFVNRHIVIPIRRAERGPDVGDVTPRAKTFVREPVVVTASSSGLSRRGESSYAGCSGGTPTCCACPRHPDRPIHCHVRSAPRIRRACPAPAPRLLRLPASALRSSDHASYEHTVGGWTQ